MPKLDAYCPDTLDAIVETSERSEDEIFPDYGGISAPLFDEETSKPPQNVKSQEKPNQHREITLAPMVLNDISFPGSISFGMPETIVEELDEEDDDSSCDDSTVVGNKENSSVHSFRNMASHHLSPMGGKRTPVGKLAQWTGQLSVSDFETGSVALFNFDDSGSDDDDNDTSAPRGDPSAISQSRTISMTRHADDDVLSWRLDPSESMSDWTIRVNRIGSGTFSHYHVHRNMLAVGQRKSAFFSDLFKQRPTETTTEFAFCNDVADYVPMALDWIYIGDSAIRLSTESAPCLRYLAQCLGLRGLFDQTMAFMKADLSTETLAAYYTKAVALEDQKILNVVARFFARMIDHIETDDEIMQEMEPTFFLHILSQPGLDRPESLVHKNLMISSYCNNHRRSMTQDEFLLLTDAKYLTHVHYGAALQLLELELDLAPDNVAEHHRALAPTSLQNRCIAAIAPRWKEAVEIQRVAVENILNRLPSFLVGKIMMDSLHMAAQDLDQQTKQAASEALDLRRRVKARVKATYNKQIRHWHELCKQKDEEIQVRNQEMARFIRLPNAFDGRLSASRASTSLNAMPTLGTHEEAGYVLTGRKLGGTSLPLFYYK